MFTGIAEKVAETELQNKNIQKYTLTASKQYTLNTRQQSPRYFVNTVQIIAANQPETAYDPHLDQLITTFPVSAQNSENTLLLMQVPSPVIQTYV